MLAPRARNPARVGYVVVSSARHNTILWKNPHIRFMKQELPLAVALLAAGSLLWLTQLAEPANSSGPVLASEGSLSESVEQGLPEFQQLPRLVDPNIALPIRVYRDRGVRAEGAIKVDSRNSWVALMAYQEEIPAAVRQEETSSVVRKGSGPNEEFIDGSPIIGRLNKAKRYPI